jgi:hypothetical protein
MIFFRKKEEIIDPYTVEKCNSCSTIMKRKFLVGDYVFKTTNKCTACNSGQMIIAKIFGEVLK